MANPIQMPADLPAGRDASPSAEAPSPSPAKPRRRQQRAIDTRVALLDAALEEFAEKGFDGASTHRISQRAGLKQPLIAYHFGSKEELWKAVAEHFFQKIVAYWNDAMPQGAPLSPAERVRTEFRLLFKFTLEHPHWHHFMLRENAPASPRLEWLAANMIGPTRDRIIPEIRQAQEQGELRQTSPYLLYYALVGAVSALPSLASEMKALGDFDPEAPGAAADFWDLIERTLLAPPVGRDKGVG